jgi:tol-pal system protein YbgF
MVRPLPTVPFDAGRLRGVLGASALALFAAIAAGCASAEGAERRQLQGLQEAMKDDTEHADARRSQLETLPPPEEQPSAPPRQPPRRGSLTTVAIGGTTDVADDGEESRPEIKIVGSPGGARKARAESRDERGSPLVVPSDDGGKFLEPSDGSSSGSRDPRDLPSAMDPAAKQAYDAAMKHVFAKRYDEGLEALAAFLVKWPDHPNADNATYWRGECYFAKGEFSRAAEQFEGVAARFPLGNKVPDALYKLGLTYKKLGLEPKAKTAFEKLQKDYPRSDAARRLADGAGAKEQRR